jgi:ataxin-3
MNEPNAMASANESLPDASSIWIYHERQEAMLCGQHALNNLAQQGPGVFTAFMLTEIAHELDQLERSVLDPSAALLPSTNVDAAGNFSIQVLKQALQEKYRIALSHLSVMLNDKDSSAREDVTEFQGFLCHKSNPDHWFAIRQVGGRFWNLNSLLERPVPLSHFSIGTEVTKWQNQGYNVYGIRTGLPAGGTKSGSIQASVGSWHLMSDLLRGKSTERDSWELLTGRGMRLDGRSTASTSRATSGGTKASSSSLAALDLEDEELQRALQASLETASAAEQSARYGKIPVPPEPCASTKSTARIQIKLPGGGRVVRRFLESDSVEVLYAFVYQRERGGSSSSPQQQQPKLLELRYGFPPKDLHALLSQTIGQAKLAGETIQGRFL